MCASGRPGGSVPSMRFRASPATEESRATRVGMAGAAVMAVAFGMARYVYGLTLPDIRADLDVPELLLGLIASGTFIGFLLSLILSTPLTIWKGPRAPTTLGSVCGAAGCTLVAAAPSPSLLAAGALVAGSAAGWVWAPYSDIVAAVAPERDRPRLLAWITTGACAGLILVGPLALASTSWASWRWTWASIAVASAAAAVLNIRWVPRIPPTPRAHRGRQRVVLTRGMLRAGAFAAVLFIAATAYFTYATDAARRGGLGAVAGPAIFVLAGATGLPGSVPAAWRPESAPERSRSAHSSPSARLCSYSASAQTRPLGGRPVGRDRAGLHESDPTAEQEQRAGHPGGSPGQSNDAVR